MRKTWIALLALLPGLAMAQEKAFTITGTTLADTGTLKLARYTLSTGQKLDMIKITDHKFTFKGTVNNERQRGQLITGNGSMLFYLEPGVITIKQDSKSTNNAVIGGTQLNREYNEYYAMLTPVLEKLNTNRFDKRIMNNVLIVIDQFITKHPESPVGLDMLDEISVHYASPDSLDLAYRKLSLTLRSDDKAKQLAARIKGMRSANVGDMAPVFNLPDTKGKNVALTDFKGKYVFIDFWATWCVPCLEEMPNVVKAYEKYKGKNFEIVGISLDRPDTKELWIKTIGKQNMTWPQVSDLKWWNSIAALQYNISSVPANFLVDPQGRIIATNLRGEALEKKLAEVLN